MFPDKCAKMEKKQNPQNRMKYHGGRQCHISVIGFLDNRQIISAIETLVLLVWLSCVTLLLDIDPIILPPPAHCVQSEVREGVD